MSVKFILLNKMCATVNHEPFHSSPVPAVYPSPIPTRLVKPCTAIGIKSNITLGIQVKTPIIPSNTSILVSA